MKNTIKDESLLTTSSLVTPFKSICLGISVALLLAGCSMPSSIANIFGEDRPAQKVGARRTPVYNNRAIESPATESRPEANTKLPPMVTNVSPERVETPIDSPYDQYDANGNEVPVAETAQAENNKGFFSGWFGADDETPKETEEPKEFVEQKVEPTVVRKSFIGNPYRPRAISSPPLLESSQLSPQSKLESAESKITFVDNTGNEKPQAITVVENTQSPAPAIASAADNVNSANNIESVSQANVVEPSREYNSMPSLDVEPQPAPENETLLGRIGSKLDVFDISANENKTLQAPEISSVPKRPEAFDAVKRDQQQNLNELKQDHSISKQEKESLEREAPAPSVPAISNQHEPSSSVKPLIEQAAPVAGTKDDNIKEELPAASNVTMPAQSAMERPAPPAPFLASEKTNMEEDAKPIIVENLEEEKPNFFERLFGKSPESNATNEVAAEKVEDAIPVYSGPVSSLSEVNIEAPSDKKDEVHEEAKIIDDLAASAVATAQSAPQPEDSSFEPVGSAESLPSPDIIKTMRPSRYDARRAQASGY
jgi:hypothetical protein